MNLPNQLQQTESSELGPISLKKESKKEVKMKAEPYFKDETMNGNSAHNIFNDFREGKNTLLTCFEDYPEIHQKYLKLFMILTKIDTL